jgi:hypothetical protein
MLELKTTGAHSAYDEAIGTAGNREDLSSVIYDLSPTETPVVSAIKKKKATAINHEWLVDELSAPGDNKAIEGFDSVVADYTPRSRLSNYTQILSKNAAVTGTQEKVLKGGNVKSEMAYAMARRMKEMKRDLEFAIIGQDNAKVAGDDSTAREMGSLSSYLTTNFIGETGSVAPAGNGSLTSYSVSGTNAALDQAKVDEALQSLWTNSGGNENVMMIVGAADKGRISGFTNANTRYVTTDDKKLVASIDVYDGDFHTVKVVADRYIKANSAFIIDPEYLAMAELRPINSFDLAKVGDSMRKQIVWETTLEVCNEKAHAHIVDLT